ncbi:nonstructural protein [Microviridae sp.]|nr:nonstructural protein [Microviridae sp.]
MKLNAYTIFDVASGIYMRPFFSQADGQAIRGFKDIATDADHEVGKHPEDYTLFRVGSFNDTTGKMDGDELEKLATGLEMVAQDRQPTQADLKLATEG